VEVQSDTTHQDKSMGSAERFAYITLDNQDYPENNGNVSFGVTPDMYSGATSDISKLTIGYFYDIDQNKIIHISSKKTIIMSLALVIGDYVQNEGLKNIKQCFNGMGYFGSTLWVDKGVKGLIPNGRNEDGTLKNKDYEVSKLITGQYSAISDNITAFFSSSYEGIATCARLVVSETEPTGNYLLWYIPSKNELLHRGSGTVFERYDALILGNFSSIVERITSFTPKQPFRALDYNDKSEISSWGMPSNKYIDLTLGASGTTYIAPANGWVHIGARSGGKGAYINTLGSQNPLLSFYESRGYETGSQLSLIFPVKKGEYFAIRYANFRATNPDLIFRFVYAEGEI
jgi:hypothetical protein